MMNEREKVGTKSEGRVRFALPLLKETRDWGRYPDSHRLVNDKVSLHLIYAIRDKL